MKVNTSKLSTNVSKNTVKSKDRSAQQYETYKDVDPFPDIEPALLNYVDAYKYIYTCGIIDKFKEEKLKGITYACSFSGKAFFCNPEDKTKEKDMRLLRPDEDGYYIINPNSITYLEIEETIRVPEYIALRFNLSVSNAYKGLLLGTGPIVDPGFVGKLYIPLHNLTSNIYKIKKGAELILIEFTKLSRNEKWKRTVVSEDVPVPNMETVEIKPLRAFKEYISKALTGKEDFRNVHGANYVSSSIPDVLKEASNAVKTVDRMKKIGIISSVVAVIGVVITVFSLLIPTWQAFDSFEKERQEYQCIINKYDETANKLEQRIISLEIDDKREQLDTLKDEYASVENNNSVLAKRINEQIVELERKIAVLQSQLS